MRKSISNHTIKLHLGCGQRYLEGYVNVDYPSNKHNIAKIKVDKEIDITTLSYPNFSVDEIRSHHVFEHFDRATALGLLCRWRNWLKPGGVLRIETPDLMTSAWQLVNPLFSYSQKEQVVRHIFGSHEASWAVHWEGWYKEKFYYFLNSLQFEHITFKHGKWGMLRSIEVHAIKNNVTITDKEYRILAGSLLKHSTVRVHTSNPEEPEGTELKMWKYWLDKWQLCYTQK